MAVMLSDLLRNLTFNRSAHCTSGERSVPLGALVPFSIYFSKFVNKSMVPLCKFFKDLK